MGRPRKIQPSVGAVGTTKPVEKVSTTSLSQGSFPSLQTLTLSSTKEDKVRKETAKPTVIEKSTNAEKDGGSTLIINYVDGSGAKRSKVFTCASIRLQEFKDQTISRTGPKTTLSISLEAQVIEVG